MKILLNDKVFSCFCLKINKKHKDRQVNLLMNKFDVLCFLLILKTRIDFSFGKYC